MDSKMEMTTVSLMAAWWDHMMESRLVDESELWWVDNLVKTTVE